jgi:hypothetical protein
VNKEAMTHWGNILIGLPEIVAVTIFLKLDMPFSLRGTGKRETRRLAQGLGLTHFTEPIRVCSSFSLFYMKSEADTVLASSGEQCPESQSLL